MKKEFVTYEIALKLKELGFDEECFRWWCWINGSIANFYDYRISNSQLIELNNHKNNCAAPLWQQAESFLRTKILFHIVFREDGWYWEVLHKEHFSKNGNFKTYEEAREQAILKCMELLKNK